MGEFKQLNYSFKSLIKTDSNFCFSFSCGLPEGGTIFHTLEKKADSFPPLIFCPVFCTLQLQQLLSLYPLFSRPPLLVCSCFSRRALSCSLSVSSSLDQRRAATLPMVLPSLLLTRVDSTVLFYYSQSHFHRLRRNGSRSACFDLINNKGQWEPFRI